MNGKACRCRRHRRKPVTLDPKTAALLVIDVIKQTMFQFLITKEQWYTLWD
jgi:hypothetical protein